MECNTIRLKIKTYMCITKNLIWLFNIIILAAALPPEWEDMKDDQVKIVRLLVGSTEYNDVEAKTKMTGLNANIISVCCSWKTETLHHMSHVHFTVVCTREGLALVPSKGHWRTNATVILIHCRYIDI